MGKAHKLTPLGVKNEKRPGIHSDGANLVLRVVKTGGKFWLFRYMIAGKDRSMGLGSYTHVGLAEARERAAELRKKLRDGIDPLGEKQAHDATHQAERAKAVTFDWCAKQYIAAHKSKWANTKSEQQWTNTLATYASPVIGKLDVARIETAHIMKILEPIWTEKAETASRLRGRIESVLGWATVKQYRTGDNPARLAGHLQTILPGRNKAASVKHHAAMSYREMAAFMPDLRTREGIAARACEFAILTAARSGEVRGATWDEIDFATGLWTIPAARMKARREHRVPLSSEALAVLQSMRATAFGDLIFRGSKESKPLSDMSLTAVLKRMERGDLTMHGFRSTFRDWAAEVTNFPSEMAEMALAHTVGDRVEAAYRRGDMLERRRAMMQNWASYCAGSSVTQ